MKFVAAIIACLLATPVYAQGTGVVRKLSENKFTPVPGLPSCLSASVQSGDPAKGASVILFRGRAGCVVPWHWHTPTEHVMIVSGSAKFEIGCTTSSAPPSSWWRNSASARARKRITMILRPIFCRCKN